MKTRYIFIILSFILFSCSEGLNSTDQSDTNSASTKEKKIIYNVSGKVQKGKCLKGGLVTVHPLDDGFFDQLPGYTGYTDDNGFNVPVEIEEEYSEIFANVDCDDEVNGGQENYRLSGIVKNSDLVKNINPLTKIRSIVARSIFDGDPEESLIDAENMILSFLDMPPLENRFTKMSLENDSTHDAVLSAVSSAILYGRTGPEQGDYIVTLADAIINDDQTIKAQIIAVYDQLPIMTIKQNLENSFGSSPPFWRLIAPELTDLLENEHIVQGSFNIGDSMGCTFDSTGYNRFAIPHIFESWIETSNYLASNLDGDLSIWTHIFDQYDRPGSKILDIERIQNDILEGPVNLINHGRLGNHNLVSGAEYYIVITRENAFRLTTACDGGLLPFGGRKLASKDNGQNWIGHNNNTSWYRKSGVMYTGWN